MTRHNRIKVALLLTVLLVCLLTSALHHQSHFFREFEAALLSLQWMLLVCLAVWCCTFILLTFSLKDLLLIGLLLIAMASYFIGTTEPFRASDALILLAGVMLGRGIRFALEEDGRWKMEDGDNNSESGKTSKIVNRKSAIVNFLVGLVVLLAFASWWHLDMSNNFYHGPRWIGILDNPNIYGMLMGAGVVLSAGLLSDGRWEIGERERECRKSERNQESVVRSQKLAIGSRNRFLCFFVGIKSAIGNPQSAILLVAVGMMAVGLVCSYSRGAWVGTAVGLLYLAKTYGKLRWRWVLPGILVVAAVVSVFWHSTADTDQWYVKRLDFSRPSAQHRVSAWRGAVQMMRDHPFGVGWNQAVGVYDKNYSPPENGAGALTTNSYLMLGTELGLPGLLCFVTYVGLCFRGKGRVQNVECRIQTACLAGALVLFASFWFDGGLFDLPAAAVFWTLLESATSWRGTPKNRIILHLRAENAII